jgi:hypothetical protein
MKFILKYVFYNENWIIHFPLEMSGGNSKIRNKNNKTSNKNNKTRKYYCPKGRIKHYKSYKNFGVGVDDV